MIKRWVALGVFSAEKRFRRIKGHQDMPSLVAALRPTSEKEGDKACVGTINPPPCIGS